LEWFQNFAGVGGSDHQLGARALARYAFMHRETYWNELVWKGDRSQAPATVASKPHYFSELNVGETIENFLENVPSFWQSEELRDSLEDGQFIALEVDYFVQELLARMGTDGLSSILRGYIAAESFTVLCQRVLPIVTDTQFLEFINGLAVGIYELKKDKARHRDRRDEEKDKDILGKFKETPWLEIVLSAVVEWRTLNDAVVCNACARNGRELCRLMQGEEHEDEARLLNSLVADRNVYSEDEHWAVREEYLVLPKWEAVKWLTLDAWLLFYFLSKNTIAPEALETLMTENMIGFLRTSAQPTEDIELLIDARGARSHKERRKSKKRHRHKLKGMSRKRKNRKEDADSESGSDVPFETDDINRQSTVSWRLSVDNYVITWTKVIIYLSK
jgi:hypothetical protein